MSDNQSIAAAIVEDLTYNDVFDTDNSGGRVVVELDKYAVEESVLAVLEDKLKPEDCKFEEAFDVVAKRLKSIAESIANHDKPTLPYDAYKLLSLLVAWDELLSIQEAMHSISMGNSDIIEALR